MEDRTVLLYDADFRKQPAAEIAGTNDVSDVGRRSWWRQGADVRRSTNTVQQLVRTSTTHRRNSPSNQCVPSNCIQVSSAFLSTFWHTVGEDRVLNIVYTWRSVVQPGIINAVLTPINQCIQSVSRCYNRLYVLTVTSEHRHAIGVTTCCKFGTLWLTGCCWPPQTTSSWLVDVLTLRQKQ